MVARSLTRHRRTPEAAGVSDGRARVATSAAFGVQGLVFASVLTRVPALRDKFGFSDGELTALLAAIPVIAGTGSVLAGIAATRRGAAVTLRISLVLACLAAAAVGLAPQRLTVILALACYGFSVGAVDAAMNTHGVAVQARYGRSIMNGFHAVWSLAGICGAVYTAAVADTLAVGTSIGIAAAVGAAIAVLAGWWLTPAGPSPALAHDPLAQNSGQAGAAPATVPWRLLLPIGAVLGCVYVADAGVSNWGAVYLRDTLLSTEGVAALGYAGYQATALLGRLAGDRLVSRYGTAVVIRSAVAIAAAGLLAVLAAGSPVAAIAGFTVLGLGASVLVPLSFSAAGQLDGGQGTAVARVNLFNYAGYLVGTPLIGIIGSLAGMRAGWLAPLLLIGVVAVLARRLDPRQQHQPAATPR